MDMNLYKILLLLMSTTRFSYLKNVMGKFFQFLFEHGGRKTCLFDSYALHGEFFLLLVVCLHTCVWHIFYTRVYIIARTYIFAHFTFNLLLCIIYNMHMIGCTKLKKKKTYFDMMSINVFKLYTLLITSGCFLHILMVIIFPYSLGMHHRFDSLVIMWMKGK